MVGERERGVAQCAGDEDRLTASGAAAPQRLPRRHLPEDGQAQVERAAGRVAADELHREGVGQGEEAPGEGGKPNRVGLRQGPGEQRPARQGPHRRHVGQVHRQRLVPERLGIDVGKKMPSADQHVDRCGELAAWRGCEQGRIVAHSEHRMRGRTAEESVDELEFG